MPDVGSTQDSTWSTPQFGFEVKWDAIVIHFQEISGLEVEVQPIEYRSGDSPVFSTIKMPGIQKHGNVTMKKGIWPNNASFQEWYNQVKANTASRKTITITLMDESGAPTMIWTLRNAWPTKVSGTDLTSDGNEVAIDTLEVAHESITITNI